MRIVRAASYGTLRGSRPHREDLRLGPRRQQLELERHYRVRRGTGFRRVTNAPTTALQPSERVHERKRLGQLRHQLRREKDVARRGGERLGAGKFTAPCGALEFE